MKAGQPAHRCEDATPALNWFERSVWFNNQGRAELLAQLTCACRRQRDDQPWLTDFAGALEDGRAWNRLHRLFERHQIPSRRRVARRHHKLIDAVRCAHDVATLVSGDGSRAGKSARER
jgi:hypothetical protein